MTTRFSSRDATPSTRQLLSATVGALAVAAVILVVAVLPAEYGVDPLGTGRVLGLLADDAASPPDGRLSPTSKGPITYYGAPPATDSATFVIGPYDYVEYKYRLERGATMQFAWQATQTVLHNFHSAPDGSDSEPSFDGQQRASGFGTFTAPSTGMHGWYWENPGDSAITVTLTSSGFYSAAVEYRPNKRQFPHAVRMGVAESLP